MISIVQRFRGDPQGSVALMFAFAALVLMGAVGAAMDYSRAANVQTSLQRAVDGAALLAAKNNRDMSGTSMSDAAARNYIRMTFAADRIADLDAKVTFLPDRVRVEASAAVPTMIMTVLGIRTMQVAGSSEALFGETKVEIVLVLDNTGSMNQSNKLPTLKQAAKNFLAKMQAAGGAPGAIRIGVVPFETDVNLGNLKGSWWVDPAQSSHWTANPATAGCIWDREQPNDVRDTVPSTGLSQTMFGADQTRTSACNIAPILPLTTDYNALNANIEGMTAVGNTNLTIGLVWGYHLLSSSEPITNALPFGTKNLTKYVILMTDGENTQTRGGGTVAAMDARTRQVCENIKAEKIAIFTARIIDGNESLLRDCASDPSMYYPVSDVAQLQPVFDTIYSIITSMRIAR